MVGRCGESRRCPGQDPGNRHQCHCWVYPIPGWMAQPNKSRCQPIVPSLPGAHTGEPPGSGAIFPGVVAHRGRGWTWMSGHGDRAAPGVAGRAAMGDPVRDDGLRASDITDRQTASGSTYWTALRSADRRP